MLKEVAEKDRKPWKISVQARARKFQLKFNASDIDPTWNFLKFSVFLRLHHFFLEVKSELDTPVSNRKKPTTYKSKFISFFKSFKSSPSKKRSIRSNKVSHLQYPESKSLPEPQKKDDIVEPMCVGSLMIGTAASLSHSLLQKDQRGIVFYGSSMLLFLIFLQNKLFSGKENRFFLICLGIAALVFEIVGFCLVKYLNYDEVWLSEMVWKTWNYGVSSGCLYVLSQVMFSRICHSVGVGDGGIQHYL